MPSTPANETTKPNIKRCAIYSRSSVEKDSRDPFDSASALFMACAEFIGPQIGKGWRLVDAIYEDRGYTGSHMRRAGFQSLLNDIKFGLIDVVVVHWLERLTRSLADFQQIMAELNAYEVPLVSVTQQIDMSIMLGGWQQTSSPHSLSLSERCHQRR